MGEWSTYSLEDFLLFRPRVYWRLFELQNEAVWPLHILTMLVGIAMLAWVVRPSPFLGRVAWAGLAVVWICVAVSFLWYRYAAINWAISYLWPLFVLQALLLFWFGGVRDSVRPVRIRSVSGLIGLALLIYALLIQPLTATLAGRPFGAAEVFGVAPDPTAIATLGLVSISRSGGAVPLLIVPLAWSVLSWATLYAMGAPEAWVPLTAAALALVAGVLTSSGRPSEESR